MLCRKTNHSHYTTYEYYPAPYEYTTANDEVKICDDIVVVRKVVKTNNSYLNELISRYDKVEIDNFGVDFSKLRGNENSVLSANRIKFMFRENIVYIRVRNKYRYIVSAKYDDITEELIELIGKTNPTNTIIMDAYADVENTPITLGYPLLKIRFIQHYHHPIIGTIDVYIIINGYRRVHHICIDNLFIIVQPENHETIRNKYINIIKDMVLRIDIVENMGSIDYYIEGEKTDDIDRDANLLFHRICRPYVKPSNQSSNQSSQ